MACIEMLTLASFRPCLLDLSLFQKTVAAVVSNAKKGIWLYKWAKRLAVFGSTYSLFTFVASASYRQDTRHRCTICLPDAQRCCFPNPHIKYFRNFPFAKVVQDFWYIYIQYVPSTTHKLSQGQQWMHACFFFTLQLSEMHLQYIQNNKIQIVFLQYC